VIGALLIGIAGYEAAAAATHGTLISHARGFWRWLVVAIFGIFVGHVVVQWARDDVRERA